MASTWAAHRQGRCLRATTWVTDDFVTAAFPQLGSMPMMM
jgi:hypothetical protein